MRNISVVGRAMYVQSADNLARPPQQTHRRRTGYNPLFRADVLRTEHNSWCGTARLLDRRAARDDEPDGLLDPALDLGAQGGADHDARIERNDLHRHVGAALLWPLMARGIRAWRVRKGVRRVWLAQKRFWERVEAEVLAGPARRERVPPIKGEVSAGIRRVEELRCGLRFVLGDEDDARAGGCVLEL